MAERSAQLGCAGAAGVADRTVHRAAQGGDTAVATRLQVFPPGHVINDGKVVNIKDGRVFVKVGPNTRGTILSSEFASGQLPDVGDELKVYVFRSNDKKLLLSSKPVRILPFESFDIGQEINGSVKYVHERFADIDIGAEVLAYLPKSLISEEYVQTAHDFLKFKQPVTVHIVKKTQDGKRKRIVCSMIKKEEVLFPLQELEMKALVPGQELAGVVKKVRDFGAFVDVGAEDNGLLHVRHINDGMFESLDDVLKPGDKLTVRVIGTNNRKLDLGLNGPVPLPRLQEVDHFRGADLDASLWLDSTVVKRVKYGALVRVPPPAGHEDQPAVVAGLWLDHFPQDREPEVGDVLPVRVLWVNTTSRQVHVTTQSGWK